MTDRTADKAAGPGRPHFAIIALVLLCLASCAFSAWVVGQRFWCDDSFISFRYARNLDHGLGLVYNAGERVEGYSNFLWVIVAWVGLQVGIEPITFTQWISIAAQCVTIALVFCLGVGTAGAWRRALIAPLLLASFVTFLTYPMTGMETTFFTMLVTLAVLLCEREVQASRAGAALLGAVMLAIALTRFDGLVLVLILLGYQFLAVGDQRNRGTLLAVLAAGLGPYHLWRFWYYPTILPNTFHAKLGLSAVSIPDGLHYIARFVLQSFPYPALVILIPFALGRTTRLGRRAAWVVLAHGSYVLMVGGDWMPHFRFLLPVLPLLFILMQQGLVVVYEVVHRLKDRTWSTRAAVFAALALLLAGNLAPLYRARSFGQLSAEWFQPREAATIGRFLGETLSATDRVAIEWAGILPYYMGHRVLDTLGLTDPAVVGQDGPRSSVGRRLTLAALAAHQPELVAPCARLFDTFDQARRSTEPHGACRYSDYMELAGPDGRYSVCVVKVGAEGYWPALVRDGAAVRDSLCDRRSAGPRS